MTLYNVHVYREMRLSFQGIEAGTPEAAARIARDGLTEDADEIDDCNGEDLSAVIDVAGDDEFTQSTTIDFEAGRLLKAVPKLLEALAWLVTAAEDLDVVIDDVTDQFDSERTELQIACRNIREILANATAQSDRRPA